VGTKNTAALIFPTPLLVSNASRNVSFEEFRLITFAMIKNILNKNTFKGVYGTTPNEQEEAFKNVLQKLDRCRLFT